MRVLIDNQELPSDVTVSITTGMDPWVNLRGSLASAKLLSVFADGTERALAVYDDANNLLARAYVILQHAYLHVSSGQPQDAANVEAVGPARGGLPDGSFYS